MTGQPLRVLTLATLFPDASRPSFGPFVERQTLGLAALPDVEVQVVAPIGVPPWPLDRIGRYARFADVATEESWKGLTVFRPRFSHLPRSHGRFDAGAMARALLPRLARLRESFRFDVIDAEFFFPDGPAAVRIGQALGVPVSIKARGADIHHWGRQPATAAQVRAAGRAAQGLLAVSEALKADMVALGMPEERIAVHYTGIDRERFFIADRAAAKAALGLAGPVVLSVGALIERKGQSLLVAALPAIPDATLVLIGGGEDRERLAALAQSAGVEARVRFAGVLPHAELGRWYQAADVMALPSASEGLANAWVEALACGVPVVTCDAGGVREAIDRPEAGRIVARDTAAIGAAIRDLLHHPPAPAATASAADRFSWEANALQLRDHLARLAG